MSSLLARALLAAAALMPAACTRDAVAEPPRHPEAAAIADQPEELGRIAWRTDFAAAQAEAKRTGKPMLVLFDEVPGCSTVKRFGKVVLSNPVVAEAAQGLFVPTLVYNNKAEHAALLKSFKEPSWNNPVVRIMRPDRTELVPRHAGDYSVSGLLGAMRAALKQAERPVPPWLGLSTPPRQTETATFGMYCFWSGEVAIGGLDGVIATQAGFLDGHEVVEVTYDPSVIDFETLYSSAKAAGQADRVFARTDAQAAAARGAVRTDAPTRVSAKDTKYQMRRHPLAEVPMSPTQMARVNAAIGRGTDPRAFLSPRQIAAWQAAR